ncbi:MAG TPA: hypothetical protein VFM21_09550 [Terriglobia bacterium]|nr:hypothetical protein [Terriglobia bacterium]
MGATPQPPRAPEPPASPRSGSNIVVIVLLILALIIVVCGITLYTGVRFLSQGVKVQVNKDQAGGQKDVSIKTPVGNFEVHKDAGDITEARLGLPIYPGAQRVADDGSASVSMVFPGQNQMRLAVGKFETPDDFDKVEQFYQDRIGSQVTKLTKRDAQGRTVFEIKGKEDERIVALKTLMTGTRIELVHVMHGENQVN